MFYFINSNQIYQIGERSLLFLFDCWQHGICSIQSFHATIIYGSESDLRKRRIRLLPFKGACSDPKKSRWQQSFFSAWSFTETMIYGSGSGSLRARSRFNSLFFFLNGGNKDIAASKVSTNPKYTDPDPNLLRRRFRIQPFKEVWK